MPDQLKRSETFNYLQASIASANAKYNEIVESAIFCAAEINGIEMNVHEVAKYGRRIKRQESSTVMRESIYWGVHVIADICVTHGADSIRFTTQLYRIAPSEGILQEAAEKLPLMISKRLDDALGLVNKLDIEPSIHLPTGQLFLKVSHPCSTMRYSLATSLEKIEELTKSLGWHSAADYFTNKIVSTFGAKPKQSNEMYGLSLAHAAFPAWLASRKP